MNGQAFKIKAPVAWLPAGLISWYEPGDVPVALVTAWIALVGGDKPLIRLAWHGRDDPLSRFWTGGDFVLNIPCESEMVKIRDAMSCGKLCLNVEEVLGYTCLSGIVAAAPRLPGCGVQIECLAGRLVDSDFDTELCGHVACLHRDGVVIDASEMTDLCTIKPLTPFLR